MDRTWPWCYTIHHSYANYSWWRHQMETFSALLAIGVGNSSVTGEFPAQRPVTRSLDIFFDLRLNKRLSKQSGGWWFETPSRPLWRHCNVVITGMLRNKQAWWSRSKIWHWKCIVLYSIVLWSYSIRFNENQKLLLFLITLCYINIHHSVMMFVTISLIITWVSE